MEEKKIVEGIEDRAKIKKVEPEIKHRISAISLAKKNQQWDSYFDLTLSLGNYYGQLGLYQKKLRRLLSLEAQIEHIKKENRGLLLNNLGAAYDSLGEYQKAIDYYEQALSMDKEYYGERNPKVATRLNNLGLAYDSLGEYQKAIEYYKQACNMLMKFLPANHPNIQTVKDNINRLRIKKIKGEYNGNELEDNNISWHVDCNVNY